MPCQMAVVFVWLIQNGCKNDFANTIRVQFLFPEYTKLLVNISIFANTDGVLQQQENMHTGTPVLCLNAEMGIS